MHGGQQNCYLGQQVWRADFGLLRGLVDRVPWEAVLKGKGVQKDWSFFKKEILKVQEQAIPMFQKMRR